MNREKTMQESGNKILGRIISFEIDAGTANESSKIIGGSYHSAYVHVREDEQEFCTTPSTKWTGDMSHWSQVKPWNRKAGFVENRLSGKG